jgi:hypothetical protein
MSWSLDYKKYKKLAKEIIFHRTELEFQEEALKETEVTFRKFYHSYCAENNIDTDNIEDKNKEEIQNFLKDAGKIQEVEDGLIKTNKKPEFEKENIKEFSKVYKLIAKKIHPDVLSQRIRTEEIEEKEEMFKKASMSYQKYDWGSLVEVAEVLKIKPSNSKKLCKALSREIIKIKEKICFNKTTYHWKFYECEEDEECKKRLMGFFVNNLKK